MNARKLSILLPMALCCCGIASGRTLSVEVNGGATYTFSADALGEMPVNAATDITIGGKTFAVGQVKQITVNDALPQPDNTVEITYTAEGATVTVAGNIASYVSATIAGAHVVVNQSSDVAEEITYRLSGESANGSLTLTGSYKTSLQLCGLTLTNADGGAALSIQNGKRIKLSAKDGSVNTLADAPGGSHKGCIDCKGHLELHGSGTINVSGNTAHGIFAKEYIEIKNLTVNVVRAEKDGVNCNQYFTMESGTLTIDNVADDGVQVSFKDDTDREDIDTGNATITGGTITATVTAAASKAIKADGIMAISGGQLTLTANGNGRYDTTEASAKSAAAISSDAGIVISGGELTLSATGSGGKGIKSDGTFQMTDGVLTVSTTGGLFAYSGGRENHNYTGSTDRLSSSLKSSPKGVKVDGAVSIEGGKISVTTTGNGAEGIESKSTLTISGGDVFVKAYDDAINSASHMYVNGGNITAIATANDGLDSNGNLYINGGYVMAFGASAPECGLDANEEGGYTVYLTGGTVLAVGGNNSVPSSSGSSRQAYATGNSSVSASQQVTLKNSSGEVLATFTVPAEYSGSSSSGGGRWSPALMPPPPPPAQAPLMTGPGGPGGWGGPGGSQGGGLLISAPGMTSGQSYTLTIGTTSSSLTAR